MKNGIRNNAEEVVGNKSKHGERLGTVRREKEEKASAFFCVLSASSTSKFQIELEVRARFGFAWEPKRTTEKREQASERFN